MFSRGTIDSLHTCVTSVDVNATAQIMRDPRRHLVSRPCNGIPLLSDYLPQDSALASCGLDSRALPQPASVDSVSEPI